MYVAVPILAKSMDEAFRLMDRAEPVADILELRLDYIFNYDISKLLKHNSVPKIVTNRSPEEGGMINEVYGNKSYGR